MATNTTPNLGSYDWVILNTSAGKDSQAMLDYCAELFDAVGLPRERVIAVHCDLGRAEWEGTLELAQEQADHYGFNFVAVKREGTVWRGKVLGDLPAQVLERHEANIRNGKVQPPWPSKGARWCTSDQKTSQVAKLIRSLESSEPGRKVRILNCLGLRADESADRAQKTPFGPDGEHWSKPPSEKRGTPGVPSPLRHVDRWLPIFDWTEEQVWDRIHASGVRYHWAYEKGMPRLSCCFCVLASPKDWAISIKFNRDLAEDYAEIERATGYTMTQKVSMQDIIDAHDRAEAEKSLVA
jgi:3'-phosphoadenosine 5'-phosphosulfate sulfotransferase (PAPS reductase)/FAD synthetase